ncbi:MAG: hypothetical protein HC932_01420 [Thermales bacterium]|nr:hypothetical protein [Thermales bacterium]
MVGSDNSSFTPSAESSLSLPFSNVSINGSVPIYATNLVGLNSTPQNGDMCNFKISKEGQEILQLKTQVQSNRACQTNLLASQLPGEGIYNITLDGTNLSQDISILNKPVALLPIADKTLILKQNKPIELEINKIANNDTKASIGILHTNSGEYKEVSNNGADDYISENSTIKATVPGEYFEKGGLYQVFAKLSDGSQTDFINLNFNDNKAGIAGSGVIVNSLDNLQVDKNITFTVQNILDRNGNIIELGDCQAEIYTTDPLNSPILLSGQIKNGNCSVEATAGTITKSGPITVTFQGSTISNDINQSRQFIIKPGNATTLGDINFEYLPARINHANTLIIGPVTDGYGNLTDSLKNQIIIESKEGLQYQKNVDIFDGFAQLTIPSSVINSEEMTVKILDNEGNEELVKTINAHEIISPLNLPNLPTTLNSDDNIVANFVTEADPEANECKLIYQRSKDELIENKTSVNSNYTCEFDFELEVLRDNQQALLLLQAGQKSFAQVVNNTASEASNSFTLNPEVRLNEQDDLVIKLITSPIVDNQGQTINDKTLRIEYNGKAEEVNINNSQASLELSANKLDNQDIRTDLDKSFLELNLSAKASVTSINSNNNLSLFMDNYNIANQSGQVKVINATNLVSSDQVNIFAFATDNCNVLQQSNLVGSILTKSHYQAGICYVEISGQKDQYMLNFEKMVL